MLGTYFYIYIPPGISQRPDTLIWQHTGCT